MRQPTGYPAKTRTDGFYRQPEEVRGHRGAQHGDNRSRNAVRNRTAQQNHSHRAGREQRGLQRPGRRCSDERFQPEAELTGNFGQVQAKKIFDLSTGDQDCNAIRKADHHWPGDELHGSAHAGCAQDD